MRNSSNFLVPSLLFVFLGVLGCHTKGDDGPVAIDDGDQDDADTGPDGDSGEGDVVAVSEEEGCDNLIPEVCLMPWPSDASLVEDASTETGFRLDYSDISVPLNEAAGSFDPEAYERLDGHSPNSQLLAVFSATPNLDDAAFYDSIERSLESDSPTVLIDMDTGEWLAHWVEADVQADDDEPVAIFMRTPSGLTPNHRYAVAYRGLADEEGNTIEPSNAFAALRDDVATDSDEIEARREGFETMFAALEEAGLDRAELQLAWWFSTASADVMWQDLRVIRSDALERLGDEGLGCTVESVEDDYGEGTDVVSFRRVLGTYTVPSYMDSADPPAQMVRDAAGIPEFSEYVEVPFTVIIPSSLIEQELYPAPLVTYGHGLLGNAQDTLSGQSLRSIFEVSPAVVVGTNWAGMSSDDLGTVASAFMDISMFPYVAERLQQGMVNQIALTRTFAGVCSDIDSLLLDEGDTGEAPVELLDPSELYFVGGSQGGIFGGTLLTISPDIERGILFVNGANFPFMIDRSIDYVPYMPYFEGSYPERMDRVLLLAMAQHLWDASDPSGFLPHISEGLDDIGPKTVLSIAANNDAQVPNLSTDIAMRMVGSPVIEGSVREPWGFEVVKAPHEGSGYITFDMGDRETPVGNEAPSDDDGGHSSVGAADAIGPIVEAFLQPDGVVIMPCDDLCDPD